MSRKKDDKRPTTSAANNLLNDEYAVDRLRDSLGLSRRRFLKLSAAAAAGASLAAIFPRGAFAQGKTTLTFYGQTGGNNVGREMVHRSIFRQFEKDNPGVQIVDQYFPWEELQRKLSVSIAGGNPPDIVYVDGPLIASFAYQGVIQPVTQYYSQDELSDIVQPSIDEGTYKGEFYGPPESQSAEAIVYSVDMLQAASITPPDRLENGWTWDKWIEALKELTKAQNGRTLVYGLERVQPPNYYGDGPMIRSAGAAQDSPTFKAISDDGLKATGFVDADAAIEAFTLFQSLFQTAKVAPVAPLQDMLATGKAAIATGTESIISNLQANYPDFKYGIAPLPFIKTPISHTGSLHYAVSAKTKDLQVAAELVKFMGNGPNSLLMFKNLQQLPGSKYALAHAGVYDTYPRKLYMDTLNQWGQIRPYTVGYQEYDAAANTALQDLTTGVNSVPDRIHELAKDIDAQLAKYG